MNSISFSIHKMYILSGLCGLLFLASCSKNDDNGTSSQYPYNQIKPTKPTPSWGPDLTPQMQAVIEALDSLDPVPLYTLTPNEVRAMPSAADAAMHVMNNYHIAAPAMNVDTVGMQIPVTGGTIHVRIYTPKTGKASYPVIVYYHGGGWVIATVDTYNASAQALAEQVDAIVVSVEYRKGPEFRFPTAHNDAYAAYKWTVANAPSFKGDSSKIAVAGESAGGNMAVAVAMMARDSSIKQPLHILSVYPVASNDLNSASYIQYQNAEPLSKPFIQWFIRYYLSDTVAQSNSPLINLVSANLSGLAPVTIINAEIDPLQSDGEMLAEKLAAANVAVHRQVYKGVTHEFFGMAAVIPEAKDAQALAAKELKAALY